MTKVCCVCGVEKPLSEFHKNNLYYMSKCKECYRIYNKQRVAATRNTTSGREKARSAARRWANKEYATNSVFRDMKLNATQARRAIPIDLSFDEWQATLTYFNNSCAYCGSDSNLSKDHLVALVHGGTSCKDNIIPACLACNCSKCASDFEAWYKSRAYFSEERLQLIKDFVKANKNIEVTCRTYITLDTGP